MTVKRECGSCTACCRVVPVEGLGKGAGIKCTHQRSTGCAIYANRPLECRLWECAWLAGADVKRPDHAGYVIDMADDRVKITVGDGETEFLHVRVVWADPLRPGAWRECHKLRAWMHRQADMGFPILVRFNALDATCIIRDPETGELHAIEGNPDPNAAPGFRDQVPA